MGALNLSKPQFKLTKDQGYIGLGKLSSGYHVYRLKEISFSKSHEYCCFQTFLLASPLRFKVTLKTKEKIHDSFCIKMTLSFYCYVLFLLVLVVI